MQQGGAGGWTDRPKITFHTHTPPPLLQASSCWCTSPGCLQENKQGGVNPKTVLAASPTMPWLPGCQQSTEDSFNLLKSKHQMQHADEKLCWKHQQCPGSSRRATPALLPSLAFLSSLESLFPFYSESNPGMDQRRWNAPSSVQAFPESPGLGISALPKLGQYGPI